MSESLWTVPLVLTLVVMLALGIFRAAEPREGHDGAPPHPDAPSVPVGSLGRDGNG